MDVLVVGSVALDSVETPHGALDRGLGGAATYASVAASYFATPAVVAVVGGDFPDEHLEVFRKRGINLDGLQIEPEGKTFHWAGAYDGDMSVAQTRVTELNVFEGFHPAIPESHRAIPYVLLGNIAPALQLSVLEQMRAPRLTLCDTMNFWIASAPRDLEQVFRKVDVICINEDEARDFCNVRTVPQAARELLKLGAKRVIIKKGSSGVVIYGPDSFFALPAFPLETVLDTTGAGDSFAGGFMGAMARWNEDSDDAYRRGLMAGVTLASFCVEDFSCRRTAALTDGDIRDRIALLKAYTRVPEFDY